MRRARRHLVALAVAGLLLGTGCTAQEDERADAGRADTGRASPPGVEAEFVSDDGAVTVHQVQQMSVVIEGPEGVVHTDPTGGAERYAHLPAPDVILVSHEHAEHYDAATLEELVEPGTLLVVPPYVMDQLPETLRGDAVPLANGQRHEDGPVVIETVPAYGVDGVAAEWHPEGRGNGYVVTVGGRRVYVAGSTQATPEMLALDDVYLALLPLYPPYATGPEEAVKALSAFVPEYAYVYQYNSERTRDDFVRRAAESVTETTVVAPEIGS
ncbi:MBL fold metallo-hydrolase [Promicromonospora sukumoe]|uniref:MBL fold metallo-hydrolase n=1 Tax=Promicromonospora sukumoe TaxID=88382 RepID=UPI00364E9A9A